MAQTFISAGASATVQIPFGSRAVITGSGTVQLTPQQPANRGNGASFIGPAATLLGPFTTAVSVFVVATSAVGYEVIGPRDVLAADGSLALTAAQAAATQVLLSAAGLVDFGVAGLASQVQPNPGSRSSYVAAFTLDRHLTFSFPTEFEANKVKRIRVTIRQNAFGGWVPVFPHLVAWEGGVEPQPPLAPNDWATYEFLTGDGGLNWTGARITAVIAAKVFDRFIRADSNSALGSAPIGGAWAAHTGTWGIKNYSAFVQARVGNTVASINTGSTDHTVHADCVTGDPGSILAVVGRALNADNCFQAFLKNPIGDPQGVYLAKYVGGIYAAISADWVPIPNGFVTRGEPTRLSMSFVGNAIKVFVNGIQFISVTDAALNTNTRAGIRVNDDTPGNRWSNFVAV